MANALEYESVSTYGPAQPTAPVSGNTLADEACAAFCKMLDDGIIARQPRFNEIRKNEDMANGVNKQALRGRSNIPFDSIVMRGYLDTLLASTDEPVAIKYGHNREQDKLSADKISEAWNIEKGPSKGAWDEKIMDCKYLAAISGRGFLKLRMGNQPKFYSDLEVCDHYDMVVEMQGGGNLDKHLYKFQMNIFRTKQELLEAAQDEHYNLGQVRQLITRYMDASWFKNNDDIFNNKAVRYAAFGVDIRANNYVGQPLYRMTEGVGNFRGTWYYMVFSREAKTWVRFQPLEDVFAWAKDYDGRGPWVSFATHRHPFIFWSLAPADDIRPIGYAMKKVVNLTIDNLEKRNWDMKAYDPKIFTEPAQLLWRQDGLVKATLKPGSNINNGIFQFQTPDTTNITINLTQFLDQFLGKQTGITADNPNQNQSDPRVGIQVANIEQTSKRMTLANKMYRKMYTDLGTMFDYGLYQFLREPIAVKIIGAEGVRWNEQVTREDVNKEYIVAVTSGLEEDEKNATMLVRRKEFFSEVLTSQNGLLNKFNTKWLLTEAVKTVGYGEEQARIALDTQIDGDEKLYAEAADSIQKIVDSEYAPLNRNATTGFVQKIVNFAQDNYPLIQPEELKTMSKGGQTSYATKMKVFDALMKYVNAHLAPGPNDQTTGMPTPSIIESNMQRRATLIKMQAALQAATAPQPANPAQGAPSAPQPAPQQPQGAPMAQ